MFRMTARRFVLLAFAGLGLVGAARAFLPRTSAAAPPARAEGANPPVIRFVKNPEMAPALQAQDLLGKPVNKDNWAGKVVLVNFWATWCPPCVEEMPSLVQMQSRLKDKGVTVLAVSVDVDESAYKKFLKDHGVDLLAIRDPDQKANSLYGTFKFPETYVIDRDGKVRRKFIGAIDWTQPEIVSYLSKM